MEYASIFCETVQIIDVELFLLKKERKEGMKYNRR